MRILTRMGEGWQEHGCQNSDDSNNHKQFDESKRTPHDNPFPFV